MLNLAQIVKEISISYPNTIQERDSVRVAIFLRDFTSQLRLENVIFQQQQAILTIDENYRAELPAGINRNGKMVISVCVCNQLFTIDIENKFCPTNIKATTCSCEEPNPCDCSSGSLCNCSTCGNVVGYAYGSYFGYPFGWGAPYAPVGRVNSANPYGSAMIEGDTIIFQSNICVLNSCYDLRNLSVYMLYEELTAASDVQISDYWNMAAQYYVLSRFMQDIDTNKAMYFSNLYKQQIYENERMIYRSKINWDSMYRAYAGHLGIVK